MHTDPVLHEIRAMANLTITVDEETLRRARARALEQGTSVNAILSEHLARFARLRDVQAEAIDELFALASRNRRAGGAKRGKRRGKRTWTRADLHER
jgi:hypothetical protein